MIELLFGVLGVVVGIIVGLLPGIGPASAMLLVYPFTSSIPLHSLFIFYFAMLLSTQYYGSISAIVYGIVGESSSVPATIYGHRMFSTGRGTDALLATANSGAIGSLFAIGVLWVTIFLLHDYFYLLFKNTVKVSIIVSAMAVVILSAKNKVLAAVALVIGAITAKVGFDPLSQSRFLTGGLEMLDGGLPTFPFLTGLMVLSSFGENKIELPLLQSTISLRDKFNALLSLSNKWSVFRGCVVGAAAGLIPGVGFVISSQLASTFERWFSAEDKPLLVAAETADKAASVTVLLPLILTGIPIITSEAMLVAAAESKGFVAGSSLLLEQCYPILLILMTITLINWVISGLLVQYVIAMFYAFHRWMYPLIIVASLSGVLYLAIQSNQLFLSVLTLLGSYGLAKIFRADEIRMIIVFSFFVTGSFFNDLYRFFI